MATLGDSPAKVLVNRGGLRLSEGDVGGAEALYREAIELDDANPTAHANLGYLLALTERHADAIEQSEQAIALDPGRSAPWAHLGMSQLALGRVEQGLASLSRAVRLDPENHFAWSAMGRALLALDRPVEAELAWASAVAARPDDVDLLVSLAAALGAQGRLSEAVRVLHRATRVSPDSARAWAQLGVVAMANQDYGTAGESLLNALDLDPLNEEAIFHRAMLHIIVGAQEQARAALIGLCARNGTFARNARALLAKLDGLDSEAQGAWTEPGP